jgi:hypothetical protein
MFKPATQPKGDVVRFIDGLFRNDSEQNSITAVNISICSINELFYFIEKKIERNNNPKEEERLDDNFVSLWLDSKSSLSPTQLILTKCLTCKSNDIFDRHSEGKSTNQIDDFKLWCDNKYVENKDICFDAEEMNNDQTFNVHSFVECTTSSTDGINNLELAHIVSILNFKNMKEKKNHVYLVVAWLVKQEKNNGIMPYPSYKYNYEKVCKIRTLTKPWISIVDASTISRPAFLIPVTDTGVSWFGHFREMSLPKSTLEKILFYNIPYERVYRRSCDGFTRYTNPELITGQNNTSNNVLTTTGIIYNTTQLIGINDLVDSYVNLDKNLIGAELDEDSEIESEDKDE